METKRSSDQEPVLLFVEDDCDWTYIFCNEFQKSAPGWKILCAREGLVAIRQLTTAPAPQALVTDINMPGMGGIHLLEWVKDQPQFRHLPIVVLTSSEDPSHRQRCAALGVSSYLDKPRSLEKLRNSIQDIVKLCEESRLHSPEREEVSAV